MEHNNFQYQNWENLMRDAFLETYKNKNDFFSLDFVKDINKIINSVNNNLKEKLLEKIWSEWEHHFFNNIFLVIEPVVQKAKEMCNKNNWDYLFNNVSPLEWFSTKTDQSYDGNNELDLSNYDEPFNLEYIYDFLKSDDIEKYNLPSLSKLDEINKMYDYRFFLVSNSSEYESIKKIFNDSLNRILLETLTENNNNVDNQEMLPKK